MDAERGEVVAVLIRLGNAGSNTATDDVTVLGEAVAVLPERNVPASSPATARQRCRSACASGRRWGTPHWLAEERRHRIIGFSLGYAIVGRVRSLAADVW